MSNNEEFSGSVHWGGIIGTVKFSSITPTIQERPRPRVLIGSSEDPYILEKLGKCSHVIKAGGAGHKLLMVALGNKTDSKNGSLFIYLMQDLLMSTLILGHQPTNGILVLLMPLLEPWVEK